MTTTEQTDKTKVEVGQATVTRKAVNVDNRTEQDKQDERSKWIVQAQALLTQAGADTNHPEWARALETAAQDVQDSPPRKKGADRKAALAWMGNKENSLSKAQPAEFAPMLIAVSAGIIEGKISKTEQPVVDGWVERNKTIVPAEAAVEVFAESAEHALEPKPAPATSAPEPPFSPPEPPPSLESDPTGFSVNYYGTIFNLDQGVGIGMLQDIPKLKADMKPEQVRSVLTTGKDAASVLAAPAPVAVVAERTAPTTEQQTLLRPSEVADQLGISGATLRRYRNRFSRFIEPSNESIGSHVRYTAKDVRVIARAKKLLEQGWTYEQVDVLLVNPESEDPVVYSVNLILAETADSLPGSRLQAAVGVLRELSQVENPEPLEPNVLGNHLSALIAAMEVDAESRSQIEALITEYHDKVHAPAWSSVEAKDDVDLEPEEPPTPEPEKSPRQKFEKAIHDFLMRGDGERSAQAAVVAEILANHVSSPSLEVLFGQEALNPLVLANRADPIKYQQSLYQIVANRTLHALGITEASWQTIVAAISDRLPVGRPLDFGFTEKATLGHLREALVEQRFLDYQAVTAEPLPGPEPTPPTELPTEPALEATTEFGEDFSLDRAIDNLIAQVGTTNAGDFFSERKTLADVTAHDVSAIPFYAYLGMFESSSDDIRTFAERVRQFYLENDDSFTSFVEGLFSPDADVDVLIEQMNSVAQLCLAENESQPHIQFLEGKTPEMGRKRLAAVVKKLHEVITSRQPVEVPVEEPVKASEFDAEIVAKGLAEQVFDQEKSIDQIQPVDLARIAMVTYMDIVTKPNALMARIEILYQQNEQAFSVARDGLYDPDYDVAILVNQMYLIVLTSTMAEETDQRIQYRQGWNADTASLRYKAVVSELHRILSERKSQAEPVEIQEVVSQWASGCEKICKGEYEMGLIEFQSAKTLVGDELQPVAVRLEELFGPVTDCLAEISTAVTEGRWERFGNYVQQLGKHRDNLQTLTDEFSADPSLSESQHSELHHWFTQVDRYLTEVLKNLRIMAGVHDVHQKLLTKRDFGPAYAKFEELEALQAEFATLIQTYKPDKFDLNKVLREQMVNEILTATNFSESLQAAIDQIAGASDAIKLLTRISKEAQSEEVRAYATELLEKQKPAERLPENMTELAAANRARLIEHAATLLGHNKSGSESIEGQSRWNTVYHELKAQCENRFDFSYSEKGKESLRTIVFGIFNNLDAMQNDYILRMFPEQRGERGELCAYGFDIEDEQSQRATVEYLIEIAATNGCQTVSELTRYYGQRFANSTYNLSGENKLSYTPNGERLLKGEASALHFVASVAGVNFLAQKGLLTNELLKNADIKKIEKYIQQKRWWDALGVSTIQNPAKFEQQNRLVFTALMDEYGLEFTAEEKAAILKIDSPLLLPQIHTILDLPNAGIDDALNERFWQNSFESLCLSLSQACGYGQNAELPAQFNQALNKFMSRIFKQEVVVQLAPAEKDLQQQVVGVLKTNRWTSKIKWVQQRWGSRVDAIDMGLKFSLIRASDVPEEASSPDSAKFDNLQSLSAEAEMAGAEEEEDLTASALREIRDFGFDPSSFETETDEDRAAMWATVADAFAELRDLPDDRVDQVAADLAIGLGALGTAGVLPPEELCDDIPYNQATDNLYKLYDQLEAGQEINPELARRALFTFWRSFWSADLPSSEAEMNSFIDEYQGTLADFLGLFAQKGLLS